VALALLLPVGLSVMFVYAVVAVLGWWRPVFVDERSVQRWVWVVPIAFAVAIVLGIDYGRRRRHALRGRSRRDLRVSARRGHPGRAAPPHRARLVSAAAHAGAPLRATPNGAALQSGGSQASYASARRARSTPRGVS
jgi:hypothetical protein